MSQRNPLSSQWLKLITPFPIFSRRVLPFKNRKVVLIISTGRTGTKFFADYFNDHPDVTAFHEPKPSRILRLWSNAFFEKKAGPKDLAPVLFSKRRKLMAGLQTPIYIESNPFIVGFAGIFGKVFSNLTVIHVVRDPRTYVRSALNHGNTHGLKKFFNDHVPFWYPKLSVPKKLETLDPVKTRTASYWKLVNQTIESEFQKNSNYHLFSFEEVFSDKTTFKKLARIIGVDNAFVDQRPIKKVNRSKDQAVAPWQQWSGEECRAINEICQPLMSRYGYGQEAAWQKKLKS